MQLLQLRFQYFVRITLVFRDSGCTPKNSFFLNVDKVCTIFHTDILKGLWWQVLNPIKILKNSLNKDRPTLMTLALLCQFTAQHVSDVNTSIFRSLWLLGALLCRLYCGKCKLQNIISSLYYKFSSHFFHASHRTAATRSLATLLFLVAKLLVAAVWWLAWKKTYSKVTICYFVACIFHNNAPSTRKLLKMDVLTSETCWAVNWQNKASVIKAGLPLFKYQDDAWSNTHKITIEFI